MKSFFNVKKFLKILRDYFLIIIGTLLVAFAISVFLVPFKIAPGGVSGLATILHYMSGEYIPIGVLIVIFNIPLFIGGYKILGKRFLLRTLFSMLLLSFLIDLFQNILYDFIQVYLIGDRSPDSYENLLLYAIYGGALMGIGLGIIFRCNATTGGADIAAQIIHHFFPSITIGKTMMFIDVCVIIFATIAFKSVLLGLYAIVTIFINSRVIDIMLEGFDYAKAAFIISDRHEEISKRIINELDRGATILEATGAYTGMSKKMIMCIMYRGQIPQLKEISKEVDKNAFIVVTDVRDVLGEGFNPHN